MNTCMTNQELSAEIQKQQKIQQTNPHKSKAWKKASKILAVLFVEVAMRNKVLSLGPDEERWFRKLEQEVKSL